MNTSYDYIIVGAGIAGASLGYRLAHHGTVAILDMEPHAGYHTTGRSAAFYAETYGAKSVRYLTTASKDFFHNPPKGFSDTPLITPRGAVHIFDEKRREKAEHIYNEMRCHVPTVTMMTAANVLEAMPILNPDQIAGGILDGDCGDLDVAAIHQGFLKAMRSLGGSVMLNAKVLSIESLSKGWRLQTSAGDVEGTILINAAGSWGDDIAIKAGVTPLGLMPLRRTIITVPSDLATGIGPLIIDLDDGFYFKAENGHFLVSPCDETLSIPCDAQPEEIDKATAVDYFIKATGIEVRRIEHSWAGLRTFAPDKNPVIGFDPKVEKFFWSVGQGGYGIQTAPAWSEVAADLVRHKGLSSSLKARGATEALYSPMRFHGEM